MGGDKWFQNQDIDISGTVGGIVKFSDGKIGVI